MKDSIPAKTASKRKRMTPYQRIVRAAHRGTGCRLSADDCHTMGILDDAVFTRAELDDMAQRGNPAKDYQP